jgi:Prealbumin-like fold domain
MSFKRHLGIIAFALLLSQALYPCSMVMIGGSTPTPVKQLTGKVVGSGRVSLMGYAHDKERSSITVPGATISIKTRTDTAFYKKREIKYPRGMKHNAGLLKDWKCGDEVSTVKTDPTGNFTIPEIPPGKYCVEIIGPPITNDYDCGSHGSSGACNPLSESFLVDVIPSAPSGTLVADISQRWPDCSGGSSLKLRTQN